MNTQYEKHVEEKLKALKEMLNKYYESDYQGTFFDYCELEGK